MAVQPKETNKKSSSKKIPLKKRRRKKTSKKSTFKKSLLIVLGVFSMISMVAFGYYLGQENRPTDISSKKPVHKTTSVKNNKQLLKDLATLKTQKPMKIEEKEIPKPSVKKDPTVDLEKVVGKPKLVIIIDDVSSRRQLNRIQALDMKITPSIFPPSERSMKSHTLARGLKHYMIHLPMESGSKQFNTQYKTLKTTFSKEQIIARVKELRVLFPTAHYVNNHTGSVFTNDYSSMLRLYNSLKKEGFMFIDSRTIASTKVPQISKKFGDTYVSRDIFIDNVQQINMIHKQLKKAVNLAKKKGYAIAIGHPHAVTMKALFSAESILKEVELIYIDDLMTI